MRFIIPEKPQPQERPFFHHKFIAMDRPKSRAAKKLVATYARLAHQASNRAFLGPESLARLSVSLRFFGARQNADLDNLYKLVIDACQGILYKNDCQIDSAQILRCKCSKGQERTEVEIFEIP